MHIVNKFLIILSVLLIVYYRILYVTLFLPIFIFEIVYFLGYLWSIYINYDGYYRIEISEIDLSELSIISIWIEYCKLQSFHRIYRILSRNNHLHLKDILLCMIIIILGLPYRLLVLCYHFLYLHNVSFANSLEHLYINKYFLLKSCKIEVYNRNIYINCYTYIKFINKFNFASNKYSKDEFTRFIFDLQNLLTTYSIHEKYGNVSMELSSITTKEGYNIPMHHYTHTIKNNTFHSTSNINIKLLESQVLGSPISSMIVPKSIRPGTIINNDPSSVVGLHRFKTVPKFQIDCFIYDNPKSFDRPYEHYMLIHDKQLAIESLVQKYFKYCHVLDIHTYKDLRSNLYNESIINVDSTMIEIGFSYMKENIV